MIRRITILLADKPPGYIESLEGWLLGYHRTDEQTFAEMGAPRVRADDNRNGQMARFRRADKSRICARLANPEFNREAGKLTFEIYPTGPFGPLLERFFGDVTLGARFTQRRGVIETITHFDIIPNPQLKELIDVYAKPVSQRTRAADRLPRAVPEGL